MSASASEQRIEEITSALKEQVDKIPERQFIPRQLDKLSSEANGKQHNLESSSANLIISKGETVINTLSPREQEREDELILKGYKHLFDNQFMQAKAIFEEKADRDPLSALALSTMAFLKAIMTCGEQDHNMALKALHTTYDIAYSQIDAFKRPSKVMSYFAGYYNYLRNKEDTSQTAPSSRPSTEYPPNGVLRAHVIKAECSLQIAILNLLHESVLDYLKCVVYLKRAYNSYSYVWQEYQKMGADHSTFMDANTISCLQFGVGSVHLILSALPAKVLNAIYAFGWKPDKQLGFLLLNQCVESKGVRSSMATVMMLTYYSLAISSAPRILSDTYKKTAMKMLLDAQQHNTNSVLYLYFAGIMARLGSDLPLSTQSFLHTTELSRKEWAEVALSNACRLEIAINHMITGNWSHASSAFNYLFEQRYGSPAFYRYMQGACYEMIGERAQAIILFAEVPKLVVKKLGGRLSDIDAYVLRKVNMFQKSGFQNLDFFVPALEYMSIFNLLPYMTHELLEVSLERLNRGLAAIQKCEELEQEERMQEIATEKPLPDYFNELASLFVIKATVLNILGRPEETALDLNWVIDHQDCILDDTWTVPFALWEAGISCWILDTKEKSQQVWKRAVDYSRFDFEHRLAIRLTLALTHIGDFTKEQS